MQPPRPESATLPRGFRFHYKDEERPTTPEKTFISEPDKPSPRHTRLRVRRRNLPNFSAPTDQFLASVAAADIPIPTIELPQGSEDEDMQDNPGASDPITGFLSPRSNYRSSPPKTPLPRLLTMVGNSGGHRPDWYMDDAPTPGDGTSRPSSAMSNPSDWSDDSYFGSSQISRPSEEGSCTSPDSDIDDPFESLSKGKGRESSVLSDVNAVFFSDSDVLNAQLRSRTRKNAPWSRDMSDHLWNTYQIYLQDPTVTPFRIGASAVPPDGVIHRVAREAKRSWKGPLATRRLRKQRVSNLSRDTLGCVERPGSPDTTVTSKSGSMTPTGERAPRVYLRWQHSSAATRNHLRELCKRKDSTSVQRHRHLQSRSPTPFTHMNPRPKDRQRTPDSKLPLSAFSTQDVALSLATSSSESMKPDGPLAKLAEPSISPEAFAQKLQSGRHTLGRGVNVNSEVQSRRLRSPFSCRTYGPSSSEPSKYFSGASLHPQSNAAGGSGPSLRSPVRFDQSRSLNGTQKRRAQHPLEEELGPSSSVLRPSVLDEQLFNVSADANRRRVRSRGFSLGDEAFRSRVPGLFGLPDPFIDAPTPKSAAQSQGSVCQPIAPALLPSAEFAPPRLGSPLMEEGTSNTFPRRLFQQTGETSTIRRTHFATIHHPRRSIESFDFGNGLSLQSRLCQLDQKLAEIREREAAARIQPKE